MRNKFVMTRDITVSYLRNHYCDLVYQNMMLSRYNLSKKDIETLLGNNDCSSEEKIALRNFDEAWNLIINSKDIVADYKFLLQLHATLMKDLNSNINDSLSQEQIDYLDMLINKPAKANTEIAIDVMMYILDKRLFNDGDVRVALMFANKIMIDSGVGILTIKPENDAQFRYYIKNIKSDEDLLDFKNWIFKTSIVGLKIEY